jgi:Subtilase family
VAPGMLIPVADLLAKEPSGYKEDSGTSFSSPLVAGAAAWVWTTRPDLDNTQLFELMRRSATDIGPPGFDMASGYGLLNVPSALSFRTPARDPGEPNEHPSEIEPHRLFRAGVPPLTRPGRSATSIVASVDRSEDPVDLYRVWAPAHEVLRAHVGGPVAVRLLPRAPRTKNAAPLAVGKHGTAAYRNAAAHGSYVYVEIRPAGARSATYTLHVTAARR